jgi:hydrogenase maturation protein HypF
MSSSLGRLLDAVGCASSIECFSDYDGEIPMRIEDLSDGGKEIDLPGHNEFERDGVQFIDFKNALSLLPSLNSFGAKDYLYSLQLEIGRAFGRIAAKLSRNGVIILSGGAAVNRFILKGIKEEINAEGKRLIMPSQVPPGDGGISIGQAIYAGLKLNGML